MNKLTVVAAAALVAVTVATSFAEEEKTSLSAQAGDRISLGAVLGEPLESVCRAVPGLSLRRAHAMGAAVRDRARAGRDASGPGRGPSSRRRVAFASPAANGCVAGRGGRPERLCASPPQPADRRFPPIHSAPRAVRRNRPYRRRAAAVGRKDERLGMNHHGSNIVAWCERHSYA